MFKRTYKPKKSGKSSKPGSGEKQSKSYAPSRTYDKPINTLNTPYLLIVESPSKCGKIEKYLGFQYRCIASQGHIRGLAKVGTGKQNYKPTYEILPEKANHVEKMRQVIRQFDPMNIFLATDDDREGEGIAWHICEVFDLSVANTHRILFHEITEKAICDAVQTPTKIRMDIVNAQQARQTIDRMIGFQISPLLTRMLSHDSGKYLSAGRCQTPTLRLVYDNEEENKQKNTEDICYSVSGTFFQSPLSMTLKLDHKLEDESICKAFIEDSIVFSHTLELKKEVEKTSAPPKPFNTSHLLQTASNVLHMSPKLTMSLCQTLYQEGHITYMRTDSRKYATPFLETMKTFLEEKYGSFYIGNTESIENKDNQNPHEAIRVTNLHVKDVPGENRIGVLYQLIWRRTLESCMSDYKYKEHAFRISAPQDHHYKGSVEIPVFLGWRRLQTTDLDLKETQQRATGTFSYLKTQHKKKVMCTKLEGKPGVPERERRYTEAGLIQKMEDLGIGRPSTFSMLVGTIQERNYVQKCNVEGKTVNCVEYTWLSGNKLNREEKPFVFGAEKNKLIIQLLGTQATDKLFDNFSALFSYDYTSKMESELDKVANGERTYEEVCKDCDQTIKKATKPIQDKLKKTYPINEYYELAFGKNHAYLQHTNEDGTKIYKNIYKSLDIDFARLEAGGYTLQDLMDDVEEDEGPLGVYEGEQLFLKKGRYGEYVVWGDNKESIKWMMTNGKTMDSVTYDEVVTYLEKRHETKSIVRRLGDHLLLRRGKYGEYIQYKPPGCKTPTFIGLKKCPIDYMACSIEDVRNWLRTAHGLEL